MIKRLYCVIILVSILFFSILFQQRSQEDIEFLDTDQALYQITNEKKYEIHISFSDKENMMKFHDELMQYIVHQDVVIKAGYNDYMNNGYKVVHDFVYDAHNRYFSALKEKFEYHGKNIDFSNIDSNEYISSEKERYPSGYFKLFDQSYLQRKKLSYRIGCFRDLFKDYHNVNNSLIYYLYTENIENVNYIKKIAENYFTEDQFDVYESSPHYHYNDMTVYQYIIFITFVISFIFCLIYVFYEKYKEITISNILGYKQIEILKNHFFKLIFCTILILITTLLLCFYVFVSRINDYTISFLINIIQFIIFIIILLIFSIILFVIYMYKTNQYINLFLKGTFDRLFYSILIFKAIYMTILVIYVSSTLMFHMTYYKYYLSYLSQKNVVDHLYHIVNINNDYNKDYSKILCENGAIACQFQYDKNSENNIPYIIVNDAYLSLYNIHRDEKEPMLIIPEKYKHLNLDWEYYKTGGMTNIDFHTEIIYTNKSYAFDNLLLTSFESVSSPIVLVINEEYPYHFHNLFLPKEKSIDTYKELLLPIMKADQIVIRDYQLDISINFNEKIKPVIFQDIIYYMIYILTYIFILTLMIKIYIKYNKKEISLKMIHGYRYHHIYNEVFKMNFLTYIVPIALSYKMEVHMYFMLYSFVFFFIDMVYLFLKTSRMTYQLGLLKER